MYSPEAILRRLDEVTETEWTQEDVEDLKVFLESKLFLKMAATLHMHYANAAKQLLALDMTTPQGHSSALVAQGRARGMMYALDFIINLPVDLAQTKEIENAVE